MDPIAMVQITSRFMEPIAVRAATGNAKLDAGGRRFLFFKETTCNRRLP